MSKIFLLNIYKVIHILINSAKYYTAITYIWICVYLLCVLEFGNIPLTFDTGHILHLEKSRKKFSTSYPHFVNNFYTIFR
jgi:hypothetical protein